MIIGGEYEEKIRMGVFDINYRCKFYRMDSVLNNKTLEIIIQNGDFGLFYFRVKNNVYNEGE